MRKLCEICGRSSHSLQRLSEMRIATGLFFLFSIGVARTALGQSDGNLNFLDAKVYTALKKSLPAPPAKNSKEQKAEEVEILQIQSSRKQADCDRAASEVDATLGAFYGAPNGPLSAAQVERLDEFFKLLRNEAGAFIGKLKAEFPRQRPFQYVKGVETCIKQETSPAYPSGHGILAELYSLILVDLFPNKRREITLRSDVLGRDRVLAGLHHPSDIKSGRLVGNKLYQELRKSKSFQEAFAEAKKSLD